MPDVLRLQEDCYVEIEPQSRESPEAKILASPGTCLAAETAETADGVAGYLIAVPVRHPDLPALNAPSLHLATGKGRRWIAAWLRDRAFLLPPVARQ
jgi:hypothetical protein